MSLLLVYVGMCIAGYFVGSVLRKKKIKLKWSGKVQTILIFCLLFIMGARLFSNQRVVSSLGDIGISACIMTILCMTGSLIAVFITRKMLKYNRNGVRNNE